MDEIKYKPIGVIHSPHKEPKGTPIQPAGAKGIDGTIVDGTPLLDIKPYVPKFDAREAENVGWLEENVFKLSTSKDDGRFVK